MGDSEQACAAQEPWYEPALKALRLAVDGDTEAALDVVEDIHLTHDWQGLQSSFQIWVDRAMHVRGIAPGTSITPQWRHVDSPELTDADSTPPAARWAGWMLVARAGDDFDQWCALMDAMPGDPGMCVEAMLQICALQVRKGPR